MKRIKDPRAPIGQLQLDQDSLVVFLDETGNPGLNNNQYPVFGLAGVVVPPGTLDTELRTPWRSLKASVGLPDRPFHAKDRKWKARRDQLLPFFSPPRALGRVAALVHQRTSFASAETSPYAVVLHSILRRIAALSLLTEASNAIIVFESSVVGDSLLHATSRGIRSLPFPSGLPIKFYRMPKSAGEAGLEVADLVAHVAGRQIRDRHGAQTPPAADDPFTLVFDPDSPWCDYVDIGAVGAPEKNINIVRVERPHERLR